MPTATRRKIMNVSGQDLVVPWLAGRVVEAGEVVLVDEEDVPAYLCQPGVWDAGDADTEQAYAAVVAQAEQEAAAAAVAAPAPFDPGPVPLGLEFVVPLTEQSEEYLAHAEPAAHVEQDAQPQRTADAPNPQPAEQPVEEPTPAAPQRTADAPTPQPVEQAPTAGHYAAYPDLAKTPAEDTVTGMLAAVRARPTL